MNEDILKELWRTDQKCEIYSVSKRMWFAGKITDIFFDDEGEWIEVKYNRTCTKQVQRCSENIRPHPHDFDDGKSTMILISGYLRNIQHQILNSTVIPKELNVVFFSFYFVGNASLLDGNSLNDTHEYTHSNNNPLSLSSKCRNESVLGSASQTTQKTNLQNALICTSSYTTIWTLKHDQIMCTMSELLFEITEMFKTEHIRKLAKQLQKQLFYVIQNMNKKKKLLVLGYIRSVQISL
eukprot:UN06962